MPVPSQNIQLMFFIRNKVKFFSHFSRQFQLNAAPLERAERLFEKLHLVDQQGAFPCAGSFKPEAFP